MKASKARKVLACIREAHRMVSATPMMETILESFRSAMLSFTRDGRVFLKAWGKIIFTSILALGIPSAIPASHCPLSTDRMPPRMDSEI